MLLKKIYNRKGCPPIGNITIEVFKNAMFTIKLLYDLQLIVHFLIEVQFPKILKHLPYERESFTITIQAYNRSLG